MKKDRRYFIKNSAIAGLGLTGLALAGCDIFAPRKANIHQSPTGQIYPEVDMKLKPGQLELRPSFETCSYYFNPGNTGVKNYVVEFRKLGDSLWRRAFEPISDHPAGIWKGSIFGLQENSRCQLRVLSADKVIAGDEFSTWSSDPPVAKLIDLSKLDKQNNRGIVISEKGNAEGWIKYTAPPGWTLKLEYDEADPQPAAVNFNHARYIILENVTIAGGYRYAINVNESEAIRIINCDISGWGRLGRQQFERKDATGQYIDHKGEVINYDAGISIYKSAQTVVERCYIHDPRNRANSWMFSHPTGPCAVHANYTRGGTVLRWNDMIGSDEHRWNDVVESEDNDSPIGGFYRDSDINGNYMAFGNDDGIELEGGGMNVRFYRNKIEGTLCGVSTGACILGPQYIIGNVITNLNDEGGLALDFIKNIISDPQGGKRYVINNTMYGYDGSPYGKYGNPLPNARLGFMRNNIFLCKDSVITKDWLKLDDFDNDLFWAENDSVSSREVLDGFKRIGQEEHGIIGDPLLAAPDRGDYRLTNESPVRDKAVGVENIINAHEDMGAFYNGFEELPFRPLELIAQPRQLTFSEPKENFMEVLLSLPSSAKTPARFRVFQNKVFNWFTVFPSSGEISPGEIIKLKVTVDSDLLVGRPLFRGAFLVRTPEGLSRPVSIYAKGLYKEIFRPEEAKQTIYLDPAAMPEMKQWVRTTNDPSVAGGRYVTLNGDLKGSQVNAEIRIIKTGIYFLLARVGIENKLDERNFVFMIGDKNKQVSFNPKYHWTRPGKTFKVIFLDTLGELTEGKYKLQFGSKDSINLNELVITDNPAVFFIQHAHGSR